MIDSVTIRSFSLQTLPRNWCTKIEKFPVCLHHPLQKFQEKLRLAKIDRNTHTSNVRAREH